MLKYILKFELEYWSKSILYYGFIGSFFSIAFILMIGTGGYFDEIQSTTEKVALLNSPYEISFMGQFFIKLVLFTIPVIVGQSIYRDFKSKTYSILYSFPISKNAYLMGKFGSAILLVCVLALSIGVGILSGEFLLGNSNPKIAEFNPTSYFVAFGVYIIPTVLIVSLMVFAIVGWTRNIFSGFIFVISLFLFQLMVENIFFGNNFLLGLLDPFGQNAFQLATKDWDLEMRNSVRVPINNIVFINRAFWVLIASIFFIGFYKKFDFQYDAEFRGIKTWSSTQAKKNFTSPKSILLTSDSFDFSLKGKLNAFFYLTRFDYLSIVKNWLFIVVAGLGILCIFFIQLRVTRTGEFNLLPFTRILVSAPLSIYSLLVIVSTFLFAGILTHQSRTSHMNELIDVAPVDNWQLILSKISAISMLQITMLLLFFLCGISIQLYNSFYQFELSLYLFQMFVILFPLLLIWNITSVFVHTLLPNIFVGLFLLILLLFGADTFEQFGISSHLLKFNKLPNIEYSDLSGFGVQLKAYFLIVFYWFSLAIIFVILTFLFWNRGLNNSFKDRFSRSFVRLNWPIIGLIFLAISIFSFLGFKVYHYENQDAEVHIKEDLLKDHLTSFKLDWASYAKTRQPKIKRIDLKLDLYPHENRFQAEGKYLLVNDTEQVMDTLLIRSGFDELTDLSWDVKVTLLDRNSIMKYSAYILEESLQPGDSIQFNFRIQNISNSIFTKNSNVLRNGTFIKHDILPRLEYQFAEKQLEPTDKNAGEFNYFNKDADLVSLKTAISTCKSQIAIAPGKLLSEKTELDRNHYYYATQHPVKFNFSFHSGDFKKTEEFYKETKLEIFHANNHDFNTDDMINGIKATLDYNSTRFGKYPYSNIRIIEFPHTEESYSATLTSNNIPSSEILFNINTKAMEGKLNLAFYVMAHELTHEWFGNQVMPANAKGAKMLTESITEYITLCIYREQFGEEFAHKFLKLQHRRYHKGRKKEGNTELPLCRVDAHQEYISYGKGAVAFNTLAHHIGKDQLDNILAEYLNRYKYEAEIYPTTTDFITLLKEYIQVEYHHIIQELFESTFYVDNEITSTIKIAEQQLEVHLTLRKFESNTDQQIEVHNELIEIGQLDKNDTLLKIDQFNLMKKINVVTLEISSETKSLIIDPSLLFLDKDLTNNKINL